MRKRLIHCWKLSSRVSGQPFVAYFGGIALGILLSTMASPVEALDWRSNLSGTLDIQFDDNIVLGTESKESSLGIFLTPVIGLTGASETTEINLNGTLNLERYRYVEGRDASDPSLDFGFRRRFDTSSLNVTANVSSSSTTRTQLEDTGILDVEATNINLRFGPTWSVDLNDRNKLDIGAAFTDSSFDTGGFVGSRSYQWNLFWAYDLGESRNIDIALDGLYNRADGVNPIDTDSYDLRIGRSWQLTESIDFSTLSGLNYRISKGGSGVNSGQSKDLGTSISATLNYAGELTNMQGSFSRSVRPSSAGGTAEDDTLTFNLSRQFTEDISLSFTASATFSESTGTSTGSSSRELFSAEPTLSWQIAERYSLTARYRFRQQQQGSLGAAKSNAIVFGVQYSGD